MARGGGPAGTETVRTVPVSSVTRGALAPSSTRVTRKRVVPGSRTTEPALACTGTSASAAGARKWIVGTSPVGLSTSKTRVTRSAGSAFTTRTS